MALQKLDRRFDSDPRLFFLPQFERDCGFFVSIYECGVVVGTEFVEVSDKIGALQLKIEETDEYYLPANILHYKRQSITSLNV